MDKRTYLVSGAGSGIGKATAFKLASASSVSSVVLLGRDLNRLEKVRAELPRPEFHKIIIADLRDRTSVIDGIRSANLEASNLVGVVANAGVGGKNHYGFQDRWDEIIQTNLTGTYFLVQECLPALKKSKEGFKNITVISSVLARLGVPQYSAYCASKAGLLGLVRSWAAELARDKILVNAICPGWVETEMARVGINEIAHSLGKDPAKLRTEEMSRVPLGKMSQPEEIAELIHFLMNGNQTSITGQSLDINGGAVMV